MSILKRRIIIAAVIFGIVLVGLLVFIICINADNEEFERKIKLETEIVQNIEREAEKHAKFRLSDVTPFEWDVAYIVIGYTDKEEMVDLMGEKGKQIPFLSDDAKPGFLGDRMTCWWVFFLDEQLILDFSSLELRVTGERIYSLSVDEGWFAAEKELDSEIMDITIEYGS